MKYNQDDNKQINNIKKVIKPLDDSIKAPDSISPDSIKHLISHQNEQKQNKSAKKHTVYYAKWQRIVAACLFVFLFVGVALIVVHYSNDGMNFLKPYIQPDNIYSTPSSDQDEITEIQTLPTAKSYQEIYKLLNNAAGNYNYISGGFTDTTAMQELSAETGGVSRAESSKSLNNANDVSYSDTNIQVAGVDEADIVKTDGKYIYTLNADGIHILETTNDGQSKLIKTIDTKKEDNYQATEMYLKDNLLVAIYNSMSPVACYFRNTVEPTENSSETSYNSTAVSSKADSTVNSAALSSSSEQDSAVSQDTNQSQTDSDDIQTDNPSEDKPVSKVIDSHFYWDCGVEVVIYDITDKANPKVMRTFNQDGSLVSSRMVGDNLYLISNRYIYKEDLESKDYQLIVPNVQDSNNNDGQPSALDADCISIMPDFEQTSYLITTGLNITNNDPADCSAVLGTGSTVYATTDTLYVAAPEWEYTETMKNGNLISESKCTTKILRYALNDGKIIATGSGEVPGNILNQYSMDEYNGNFRIATTVDSWDEDGNNNSVNNLYILDSNLNILGKVENLAQGESIKSVRFMGAKVYIVTFETVDPLFVIDASNPSSPKVLGQLKIPGFSEYLHPYSENLIIGFGYDTTTHTNTWEDHTGQQYSEDAIVTAGLKLSLFDVSDPVNPKEIDTLVLGEYGSYSEATYNPKAFLFSKEKGIIGFPATLAKELKHKDGYYYSETEFTGYCLVNVDENGFSLKGKVSNNKSNPDSDYTQQILRGLYINDILYTVSYDNILSFDLNTLDKIDQTDLPNDNLNLKGYVIN